MAEPNTSERVTLDLNPLTELLGGVAGVANAFNGRDIRPATVSRPVEPIERRNFLPWILGGAAALLVLILILKK